MNRKVLIAGLVVTLPLVGLLLVSLGRDPHQVDSPLIGQKAASFSLRPVGGGAPVTHETLRGRTLVVNFWATWCVPCYQELPVLQQAARSMGEVTFLGVVYEDEEAKVASRHDSATIASDRAAARPSRPAPRCRCRCQRCG